MFQYIFELERPGVIHTSPNIIVSWVVISHNWMFRWFPTNTCTKDVLEYAVCTIKFIECIRIIIKNLNKSSLKLFVIVYLFNFGSQSDSQWSSPSNSPSTPLHWALHEYEYGLGLIHWLLCWLLCLQWGHTYKQSRGTNTNTALLFGSFDCCVYGYGCSTNANVVTSRIRIRTRI